MDPLANRVASRFKQAGLLAWPVKSLIPGIVKYLWGDNLDPSTFEYKMAGKRMKFRVQRKKQVEGLWAGAWGWLAPQWSRNGLELDGDWSTGERLDPPKL